MYQGARRGQVLTPSWYDIRSTDKAKSPISTCVINQPGPFKQKPRLDGYERFLAVDQHVELIACHDLSKEGLDSGSVGG